MRRLSPLSDSYGVDVLVFGESAEGDARVAQHASYLSEALLWRELRARPHGLRFCRQHATGKYKHDFYCSDARLAIELDDAANDTVREEWLQRAGISTLRVTTQHVLDGTHQTASEIVSKAMDRLPGDHPSRAK
ncbi:MAG: DUF559 domain-containing protein [Sphingomonadales bacterium]|nr:MAG: DUF559 domain-containing protein [Sphingomonadales bacterium]